MSDGTAPRAEDEPVGPRGTLPPEADKPVEADAPAASSEATTAGASTTAAVAPEAVSPPEAPAKRTGPIDVEIVGRTDVGQVREHNEDNFVVADLTRRERIDGDGTRAHTVGPSGTVLGVCDGMGGAAAGEVASQLAVDIVFERLSAGDPPRDRDELARRLVQAVEAAGLRIFSEAKLDRARRGMGTTATIAALCDDHIFFAQVGDSRAYLLRGDKLVQVTRDQSLVNQLIEAGQLTEEEAETFEHNNIILQALGTADTVQVDLTYVELRRGDRIMLCSDGLSGMVRFDDLRETLLANDDPAEACRVLIQRANLAGGHDNVTVIVARFDGEGLAEVSAAEDPPRYRKYALPEEPARDASAPSSRRGSVKVLDRAKLGADVKSLPPGGRATDHGPSRSKVAHTMVGDASLAAAAAEAARVAAESGPSSWQEGPESTPPPRSVHDDEPVTLPTTAAPAWLVAVVVLATLAGASLAAYHALQR